PLRSPLAVAPECDRGLRSGCGPEAATTEAAMTRAAIMPLIIAAPPAGTAARATLDAGASHSFHHPAAPLPSAIRNGFEESTNARKGESAKGNGSIQGSQAIRSRPALRKKAGKGTADHEVTRESPSLPFCYQCWLR